MICLCITFLVGYISTVSAAEKPHIKYRSNVVEVKNNSEMQTKNLKLENCKKITEKDIRDIKKYSYINIKKIDSNNVELIIANKVPDKIVYFDDGAKEEYYTTSLIYGSIDEEYNDLNVTLYAKMSYAKYSLDDFEYARLITGYGKLVDCAENGYRNLKIIPTVFGSYQNPDGRRGVSSKTTYPLTISSPKLGVMYSKDTNNPNYYSIDTGTGLIKVEVSIEWRHGTRWYTTSHEISLGGIDF